MTIAVNGVPVTGFEEGVETSPVHECDSGHVDDEVGVVVASPFIAPVASTPDG
ncbi:MAG: hypothetical protein ACRDRO_27430 [Pseudonocardiaceae bacterium]